MPPQSETERRVAEDARLLAAHWRPRNDYIEATYTLRRLVDRWKQSGAASYVTNRPKVFFDMARRMISASTLNITAKLGDDDMKVREQKALSEAAVHSIIRGLDQESVKLGRLPWRTLVADQILLGWVNIFYGTYDRGDGTPWFRADVWDNLTVYPEWDDRGLSTVVHDYTVGPDAAVAKARFFGNADFRPRAQRSGRAKGGVRVIDWWRRENGMVWHALLIDDQEVIPIEEFPDRDEIPCLVMPINGEGRMEPRDDIERAGRYMGLSVLDKAARTIEDFNDWGSMLKEIMRVTANPNWADFTEDGQGFLDVDKVQQGKTVHHGLPGDRAEPLAPPPIPRGALEHLAVLDREMQLATVSDAALAQIGSDASGVLFSQLMAAALQTVGPYHDAYNMALSELSQSFVEEYRDHDFKPIRIKARMSPGSQGSSFFFRDWKPSDVPQHIWIAVESELAFTRNRLQELNAARMALPGVEQILDHTTVLDEIMGIADPLLVQERIEEDRNRRSQEFAIAKRVIELRRFARYYRQEGDVEAAEILESFASRIELEFNPGGRAAQQQQREPGINPAAGGIQGRNGQSPAMVRALLQRTPPQSQQRS